MYISIYPCTEWTSASRTRPDYLVALVRVYTPTYHPILPGLFPWGNVADSPRILKPRQVQFAAHERWAEAGHLGVPLTQLAIAVDTAGLGILDSESYHDTNRKGTVR